MKRLFVASIASLILFTLTGCATRSISDSGYRGDSHLGRMARDPAPYRGELNELDVLGIQRTTEVTDKEIAQTLEAAMKIRLRKGDSLLLVQSGARWPDEPMTAELSKTFNVIGFSGIPNEFERESYHRALRLAAARGGCSAIVCYWGVLESARTSLDSKAISWVPIVGSIVPDETQHMRIRLKVAIIDTRTGNWTMFSPAVYQDEAISMRARRERSDQGQVTRLKEQAYAAAAGDLVKSYAN